MTTYRAVVKYPLDATEAQRIEALVLGIEDCAVELVALGRDRDFLERAFEEAQSAAEHELEMRKFRDQDDKGGVDG